MFITADLLREYDACGPGLKYIERFYPNGAEMIELIRDRHMQKSFLHWGREHLIVSELEEQAYCEACKIVNSKNFWHSVDILNSENIVGCKHIENCRRIFDSNDVTNSIDVSHGENVLDSKQVFDSIIIENSEKIYKSKNVSNSVNVCNSIMISNSKNISSSKNIFDCLDIIECETATNSYFCKNCANISNCLFCSDLKDAEYHIFNTPVDKKRFEVFMTQYQKYQTEPLRFVEEWPEELITTSIVKTLTKFDEWYKLIPEKFWKWARTLPGFDPMLIYNITMLPEILVD